MDIFWVNYHFNCNAAISPDPLRGMPSLLGGLGGVLGWCSGVKVGVEDAEPGAGREDI